MEKIVFCRNCKSKNLKKVFSLGKLSYSGKFAMSSKINIPKEYISLVICKSCNLLQLDRDFNPKYMYSDDYGYRSGLNRSMRNHLKNIAYKLSSLVNLKKNDLVLDIASNDGTLLNSYRKKILTVGIDPTINKFKNQYKKINFKVSDFFSYKKIKELKIKSKFKIITAISMFYDLKDPNKFLADVRKILDEKNGIFLLEHADLYSIIKYNLFDTICHEHLEYYSFDVMEKMISKNGLKIINVERNDINGGSTRFYISHENSKYKKNKKNINRIRNEELKMNLNNLETFKVFFKKINLLKKNLLNIIREIKNKGKTISGYGASTKGNILLQTFGIDSTLLDHISDRNIEKDNYFTPGTKIKIITEKKSRKLNPEYYLVLPWHFKNEILSREKKMINKGTKFIFPLPKIKIISK